MLCNDQAVMPFQCLQMDCNTRVWYVERLSWGLRRQASSTGKAVNRWSFQQVLRKARGQSIFVLFCYTR